MLVVAGPEKDLLPETTAAIQDYVKQGGKALVLVEAELKESYPNLVALLKGWNIEAGKDVVVDVSGMGQLFGFSELAPLAIEYPYHAITKDFRLPTLYGGVRSVKAGTATLEGVSAQDLVKTSEQSWAETDLTLKGAVKFDEGQDQKGPVSLAVVATVRGPAPAPTPTPSPAASPSPESAPERAQDARGPGRGGRRRRLRHERAPGLPGQPGLLPEHGRLARRGRRPDLDPPARRPENQALFLDRQKQQNVALTALVLIPGIFVVAGIVSWWRRR